MVSVIRDGVVGSLVVSLTPNCRMGQSDKGVTDVATMQWACRDTIDFLVRYLTQY